MPAFDPALGTGELFVLDLVTTGGVTATFDPADTATMMLHVFLIDALNGGRTNIGHLQWVIGPPGSECTRPRPC